MRVKIYDYHLGNIPDSTMHEVNQKAFELCMQGADDDEIRNEVYRIVFRRLGIGKRVIEIIR